MSTLSKKLCLYITLFYLLLFTAALILPSFSAAADDVPQLPQITVTPQSCKGDGGFVPLECFQDSAKLRGAYSEPELGPFLQKVFVGAISLGAILAVLRLAWAGLLYMGDDLWSNKQKAREVITDALLGLFLLLAIYLILNQINPDILKLKLNITKLPSSSGQETREGDRQPGNDFNNRFFFQGQ